MVTGVGIPGWLASGTRLLLPSLDPALVQRLLRRSNYSGVEEREAETLGSLLLERMVNEAATRHATDVAIDRVGDTLQARTWMGRHA